MLMPSARAPKLVVGRAVSPNVEAGFDEISFRTVDGLAIYGGGTLRTVVVKVEPGYARPSRGAVLGVANGELILARPDMTTTLGAVTGRAGRVGATTRCGVVVAPDQAAVLAIDLGL